MKYLLNGKIGNIKGTILAILHDGSSFKATVVIKENKMMYS